MIKRLLIALTILGSPLWADQVAVTSFKGINTNENSAIIMPSEAQDSLNIDYTPGGKSFKKRPGYGLYKTLSTSQALHGGYHFFDSSGNDVQVWGSSTSLYGIIADTTPTQLISSATLNSTWDCADTQGAAYCVTSNRDAYIKTNGATIIWNTTPLGTMVEATPDRIALAGVSGNLSTIYHSGSNAFTTFTVGPLTTDPFQEVIAAPGSKLTHLRWACNKLLWWKEQSFGYEAFDDQYSLQIKIISDNIGTFDNTSAVDPGGNVWFRGQDGHIWRYDCSGLTKESIEITPFVQASGRRTANNFTQTTQADWQLGSSSPTFTSQPLSFTISPGDVVPGSFTVTENSSTQWSLGTVSNLTVGTSSISLSTNNSGNITDNGFETNPITTNWTVSTVGSDNWVSFANVNSQNCGVINPDTGSRLGSFLSAPNNGSLILELVDQTNTSTLVQTTIPNTSGICTYTSKTISSSGIIGKRFRLKIRDSNGSSAITNDSYILGGDITLKYISDRTVNPANFLFVLDSITSGSSTITSGSFTSQAFNTGLPFGFVFSSATWNVSTTTPTFVLQKSSNGTTGWTDVTVSTNSNSQINLPYVRYLSTFTIGSGDSAQTSLTGVNILERSSGTYFSQVKNDSGITAWSSFNATKTDGDGSHAFFVRAAATPFTVLSATPTWGSQTNNAVVSTNTGVYFQFIDSFTITSATGTVPTLNDVTINWFDGTASDQAYMLYFDNAIWTDVSYGVGVSSNTYIFKRDLINDLWTPYNFGAGGMLVQNNHLYFGDVASSGKIFQYDSGHSDAGSTINAFWKSKDFTGQDPFLKSSLLQIDTFAKKDQGSTLTATYALDTSTTTTSYSISLSSSTQSIIQNRKLLPSGKDGYVFNLRYGDVSDSSNWEIFGFRIGHIQQPYRPTQ